MFAKIKTMTGMLDMWKYLLITLVILVSIFYFENIYMNQNSEEIQIQKNTLMPSTLTVEQATVETQLPEFIKITPIHCDELPTELTQLNFQLQKMLKRFHIFAQSNNISQRIEEYIVKKSGMSNNRYRELSNPYNYNLSTLDKTQGISKSSPLLHQEKLTKALNNKEYNTVIKLLKDGSITANYTFANKSVLSAIIINDPKISIIQLEQLMRSGLTPALADFVEMTKNNLPRSHIEQALIHVYDQEILHKLWLNNYSMQNLTISAARNFNANLFSLWYDLGISAVLPGRNNTALDAIVAPKSTLQIDNASQIFKRLASDSIYPYGATALDQISTWLPTDIKTSFKKYLSQQPNLQLTMHERNLSMNFEKAYTEFEGNINSAQQQLIECNIKNSNKDNRNSDNTAPNNPKKTSEYHKIKARETVQGLLSYYNEMTPQEINIYEKVSVSLTKTGKINLKEFLPDATDEQIAQMQLIFALQQGKPYKDILTLLQQGAQLPELTITLLTIRSDLILTKQLIPHGLNILAADLQGNNALYNALKFGSSNQMFDYLLDSGVSVTVNKDLLSLSIKAIGTKGDTLHYLRRLTDYGLKITLKHYQILKIQPGDESVKYKSVKNFIEKHL